MRIKGMMISALCAMVLSSAVLTAQKEQKQKLTKDAWKQAMDEATAKRDQLKSEVDELDKVIAQLKKRDAQLDEEIRKGNEELTALLGESQRKEFETQLTRIETNLNKLEQLSEQTLPEHEGDFAKVQSSIAEARAHKLAQLLEYKDRIDAQQRRLEQTQSIIAKLKTESKEIVVGTWAKDGACLWNIAKKQAVYGNPALWVKLWRGNKSQISDPDVIHPGQKLRVPKKAPLTADEMTALRDYHNERSTHNEHAFVKSEE